MAGASRGAGKELLKYVQKFNKGSGKDVGGLSGGLGWVIGAIGGMIMMGWVAKNAIYNVEGGQRAIIFKRLSGIDSKVYSEGLNFKIPWFEIPIIYNIRAKPHNISSFTGSKDLQMVNITLRVISKPNIQELPNIYRRLGKDFDDRVLPSVANEVLKSVVAQFTAAELITMRSFVSQQVRNRLVNRCLEFGIELDDVSITHLTFGKEYANAIEAKQVAQQEAERAKFVVERAKQTKLEIIAKAEGEARAAILFNEQMRHDPHRNFLTLRQIDAAKEIAQIIAQGHNRVYLDSKSLLFSHLLDISRPPPSQTDAQK